MSASDAPGLGTATKVGAAVVVLLLAGSAAGFVLGVGPFDSSGGAPIAQVPEGTDAVLYVDGAIRDDSATKTLVDETLSQRAESDYYAGPESSDELLNRTRGETSLDPAGLNEVLTFGKYPPEDASPDAASYWGAIVHADWSTDEVTTELRNQSTGRTWTESSYNGHTVYKSEPDSEYQDPSWFAVLGDGEYAVGSPEAVEDSVDVVEGDASTVGDDLRDEYDGLRDDALVAFVADVPRDRIPERSVEQASRDAPVNYNVFTGVEMVSGVYYTSSDSLGVAVNLHATDSDAARDVDDVTQGGISFAAGSVSNESVKQGLRDIEVSRDGSTVTVSYEKSVSRVQQLLAAMEQLGA